MTLGVEASKSARPAAGEVSAAPAEAAMLESRGWTSHGPSCEPKIAALAALAELAPPAPVASVSYHSRGNLLIVAGDEVGRARSAAARLAPHLHATVLSRSAAPGHGFEVLEGEVESVAGHLGEFNVALRAAGAAAPASRAAKFDLVLDFSREPLFAMRQPPQGYFRAPAGEAALAAVEAELREAVGEFEKPRFFAYRENLCAHARSEIVGCNACIEICSTRAIAPRGDKVEVDPHLCMGCGACATVCPSGAMGYQYPRVSDRGAQLKQLLAAYRHAGGRDACVVFHNGADGRELLAAAAAAGGGLPARALPLETWHVAAIGLDLVLPAIAFGASQVVVLCAGSEDPEYVGALREQMAIGQAVLAGLGYTGTHFAVIEARSADALESAFAALEPAAGVAEPAAFAVGDDKRTVIEFAVEHLARHARTQVAEIALPAGAPFGEVRVDKAKCTMCLACVGSCPESALMDGVDAPLIKFVERNCVQCGLCESTCPEDAISLAPRLLLGAPAREARMLNETQPFHCVSCNKPFGTRQMVEAMLGRLAGHSMFAGGEQLRRLQMCADCRVVDMMKSKDEVSVLRLGGGR